MARIRTIKPGFWTDEELSALPPETHLLAAALLNYADDEGYFNANPKLIKAECCPLRDDSVSIHGSLTELSKIEYLRFGTGLRGKRYGHIINFCEHQRINRPSPSKIKHLDIVWDDSVSAHTQLTEDSLPEGNGREGNKEGKGKDKTTLSGNSVARRILDFLNEKTGHHYQPVKANLSMIQARLTESDEKTCRQVIAKKCRDWAGTDMEPYLRPATLFNALKFAQYQGELGIGKQ